MRSDFTTAFATELTRTGRAPVQLLAFYFPLSGTVRISDRALGVADGLANDWAGLVEDWGTLEDIVAADVSQVTIEARQMSISIINRGETPFSDYFLREDPEGVTVDLFQWFEGLTDADRLLIDRFVVADPIQFSERGRLVTLDLVSAIVNMDAPVGSLLMADAWPNAKNDDIGKAIDLAVGTAGRVPTLCAKTAPIASLNGSILSNTLTIAVHEDLDALSFSAAGTIQIDEEFVRYDSRTDTVFNVVQRGYLSNAVEHLDRVQVVEHITDHTYLTCKGPVQSIDEVQVGGYPAPAGIYTIAPELDPARIIFDQKPYAYRFAAGSSFLAMQFDADGDGNTAYQAYKAYDAGDDATAARIDENNRVLALKQATVNPDRGEIVKAYLAIEHWESDTIINDFAEVWVEGVGVVGRLSRPNEEEGVGIDAEVDIDHGHAHEIGSEHTHAFIDPTLQTSESAHTHITNASGATSTYTPISSNSSFTLYAPYEPGNLGQIRYVNFPGAPRSWQGALLRFTCDTGGCRLYVTGKAVASGNRSINIDARSSNSDYRAAFVTQGDGVYNASASIWNVRLEVTVGTEIQSARTGADTQVAISGRNMPIASDKHANDVIPFADNNVAVTVNSTQSTTRSHVNLFDLTQYVAFDWAWFTDRDIRVSYTGSDDNQSVYILHAFFDVEFRARERIYTDEVTALITGKIDDGAGTITGTPNALITRPDHLVKYLLTAPGAMDSADIDATGFDATGARCAAKTYSCDGILRGDATVKEAIKAVAYQSRVRPFFSAGLAKLAFVEALTDWPEENPITADQYQLNSMQVTRQPATAIVNQVDLFYQKDWTNDEDGPAGYSQSVRASDAISIARFGTRNDPSRFLFDLVRDPAMAADLAAFYVDRFATPSSYYALNVYLEKFALEKEDKIQLTAAWNQLRKAKMRVLGASRVFGSGKNNSINHVALLLECLRYILIKHEQTDTVLALDALTLSTGKLGEFSEVVSLVDQILATVGATLTDDQAVTDILSMVHYFAPLFTETITATDAIAYHVGIGIEETVNILDDVDGWRQFGFGGGDFGIIGFGGWIVWTNREPDEVAVFEQLLVSLTAGALAESVSLLDAIIFNSGFGDPLGSGFGVSNFGN